MSKLTEKKQINALIILCAVVYFVSYITRLNYSVVLVEIMNAENLTKTAASLVLTWNAVAYGIGQPISGYLGDKLNPANIIYAGLLTSTAVNMIMPLSGASVPVMTVLWVINGFAQAMMWPPLIKILTNLLSSKDYKRACVTVATGSSVATILLYLISPALILLSGWKVVFFFSAACGLVTACVWKPALRKIQGNASNTPEEIRMFSETENASEGFNRRVLTVLFMIMLAIVLQGYLRDGVATWMPSFIAETYNTNSSSAILSSVVLPIFSILCFHLVAAINMKLIKNEMLCAGFFFVIGALCATTLSLNPERSMLLALAMNAVITGCMHGVNLILNTYVPSSFRKYGRVSLVSGVLNSCTYVGSAIASFAIAATSEFFGWSITIFTWALIAFAGTAICCALAKTWNTIK